VGPSEGQYAFGCETEPKAEGVEQRASIVGVKGIQMKGIWNVQSELMTNVFFRGKEKKAHKIISHCPLARCF